MLNIERSSVEGVVLALSGRIELEDVAELERLLGLEVDGQDVALDLKEVTLVDRDAVRFLEHCEASRIRLANCPGYIREWIVAEKSQNNRQDR